MFGHNNAPENTPLVGSFIQDKHSDFKDVFKALTENLQGTHSLSPVSDIAKVVQLDNIRESYKNQLIGDVLHENFENAHFNLHKDRLEQLFENTAMEIVAESSIGQLDPIVGTSLPILKKNFLECHSKDIVMTEVPSTPIVKQTFERKFFKDKLGKKYYIPEVFYNEDYKEVVDAARGKKISSKWYANLPIQDLDILGESGGSLQFRDELAYDFVIEAVKIEVPAASGVELKEVTGLSIAPDYSTGNGTYRVKTTGHNDVVVEETIMLQMDFYAGKVTVATAGDKIKEVRFGGHLKNENNTETVELDRERETMTWVIPDDVKLNTGITVEKIRDQKALFNIDVTADLISDMSQTLTQLEDSRILSFLDESLNKWKGRKNLPFGYDQGFTEFAAFNAVPPATTIAMQSQYISSELKFNLERQITRLKKKLRSNDIMFVIYGNPENITLIQDQVKWIIQEDTKIGGIQLEYSFGVYMSNKDRIHVVSSMKVDESKGLRIVAFPTSKEIITFKHLKYSLNIENSYRNPFTPLTPNIMATSRYLTTEVLPVQGQMVITGDTFGRVV